MHNPEKYFCKMGKMCNLEVEFNGLVSNGVNLKKLTLYFFFKNMLSIFVCNFI